MQKMTTPAAQKMDFSWIDVEAQAQHAVNLLQNHGDEFLALVTGTMKLISLATARDLSGVFLQLNQEKTDITALIASIKAEFGIA